MTSKTLFFNLLRENLKRRLSTVALSLTAFFFTYPVAALLLISEGLSEENAAAFPGTQDPEYVAFMLRKSIHAEWLSLYSPSSRNYLLFFLMLLLAVLLSLSGFRYLETRKQTDFLHSLPVSRTSLFLAVNLNSFLIAAVPCLLMGLCSGLIMQYGTGYTDCVPAVLLQCCLMLIFFLLFSMTAVLAVMLTGNLAVCLAAVAVFLFWGPLSLGLLEEMKSVFFRTDWGPDPVQDLLMQFSSPWCFCLDIALKPVFQRGLAALIAAALLFFLNLFLYRKRPSEAAEKAMAFPVTEAPVKCILSVTAGIAGAVMFYEIRHSTGWSFFGLISGTVLTHCIMEIIYRFDFKKLFSRKRQLAFCLIAAAALFSAYRFDLTGFDRYIPKEDQVESAALFSDALESDLYLMDSTVRLTGEEGLQFAAQERTRTEADVLNDMRLPDPAPVFRIAEQAVSGTAARKKPSSTQQGYTHESNVLVAWHLKNGRTVYRSYYLDLQAVREDLDLIHNDPAFKTAVYPVLSLPPEQLSGVNYQDVSGPDHVPGTSAEGLDASPEGRMLLQAYKTELSQLTADTRRNESPVACLQFKDRDFQNAADTLRREDRQHFSLSTFNNVGWYPVYPSFTETLSLLEKQGVQLNRAAAPEEMEALVLVDQTDPYDFAVPEDAPEELQEKEALVITDKEEIRKLLSSGVYFSNIAVSNPLFRRWDAVEIRVRGKNGREDICSFRFHADRVPDEVRSYFGMEDEDSFLSYVHQSY